MNRKKFTAACMMMICFLLIGCSGVSAKTSISYTFSVETGDSVKITLDTSDGYSMTSDLPFAISKDDETLSQGTFITADTYYMYVDAVNTQENIELLESKSNNHVEYIFWCYSDTEYDYAILLKDSNTGILLGNNISRESAEECFERMQFTVIE